MAANASVASRLAAILSADVVGYSRLMKRNDTGMFARLRTIRDEVVDPAIVSHDGRIVKTAGDGLLAEFRAQCSLCRRGRDKARGRARFRHRTVGRRHERDAVVEQAIRAPGRSCRRDRSRAVAKRDGVVRKMGDLTTRAVGIDYNDAVAWANRALALAFEGRMAQTVAATDRGHGSSIPTDGTSSRGGRG